MTGTPFSYTFYSTMSPQASIMPHFGACNLKLRCHFPLFVPEESFLRVAGDPRPWEEGKMIVFDDSYEHEAANLSLDKDRVIILIDIWHPDLIAGEIEQIKRMFAQVEQMIRDRQAQKQQTPAAS